MHTQHPAGCALFLSGWLVKGLRYNVSALNQSGICQQLLLLMLSILSRALSRALPRALSLYLSISLALSFSPSLSLSLSLSLSVSLSLVQRFRFISRLPLAIWVAKRRQPLPAYTAKLCWERG